MSKVLDLLGSLENARAARLQLELEARSAAHRVDRLRADLAQAEAAASQAKQKAAEAWACEERRREAWLEAERQEHEQARAARGIT